MNADEYTVKLEALKKAWDDVINKRISAEGELCVPGAQISFNQVIST